MQGNDLLCFPGMQENLLIAGAGARKFANLKLICSFGMPCCHVGFEGLDHDVKMTPHFFVVRFSLSLADQRRSVIS